MTMYEGYNQAFGVVKPNGNSSGGTVRYMGSFPSTQSCADACEAYSPDRCWSFVHFPPSADSPPTLDSQCFAVTTPGFNPSYDTTAVSGVLHTPDTAVVS